MADRKRFQIGKDVISQDDRFQVSCPVRSIENERRSECEGGFISSANDQFFQAVQLCK